MDWLRRKRLEHAKSMIEEARIVIQDVKGKEQEAFYKLPEWDQINKSGEQIQDDISDLEDVCDSLQESWDTIDKIIDR